MCRRITSTDNKSCLLPPVNLKPNKQKDKATTPNAGILSSVIHLMKGCYVNKAVCLYNEGKQRDKKRNDLDMDLNPKIGGLGDSGEVRVGSQLNISRQRYLS